MDNIQIKRTTPRRNIQSLIQQSALDNSYNHQAQQLRQAYTKTIKQLNIRIKQLQTSITKLQIELNQKDEIIIEQHQSLQEKQNRIAELLKQGSEMNGNVTKMKKRLQHVQYKLENIEKNRKEVMGMVMVMDAQEESNRVIEEKMENNKKQVYKEVKEILNHKISKFVKQLKTYTMATQLQNAIQAFLEDILFINSNQNKQNKHKTSLFEEQKTQAKNRRVGKISQRKNHQEKQPEGSHRQKMSEMEQWKKMQKSLQKLKSISPMKRPPAIKENRTRLTYYSPINSPKPLINYT